MYSSFFMLLLIIGFNEYNYLLPKHGLLSEHTSRLN
uniref:Uncharacterized protein n=1 Tax=Phyllymenia taiwanensis TaxID=1260292 RepID=R9XWC6_9FLOR|nr:hypothetical protein [Grateloupia taiwanensis]AGO19777.1 hypothetical protein [Grateloupia taiwanensis]